jgi:hypothetical protein
MSYEDNAASSMSRYEDHCEREDTQVDPFVKTLFRIAQDRGDEIERLQHLILYAFESEDAHAELKAEVVEMARRFRQRAGSICKER